MSRVDPILALIDNALCGDTSPDAMRWAPEEPPGDLPMYFGPAAFSVSRLHVTTRDCYLVADDNPDIQFRREPPGTFDMWIEENTLTRDELRDLFELRPTGNRS